MCFTIVSEAKIAEKNVICYKIVKKTPFSWLGFYRSKYRDKLYSLLNFFYCKRVVMQQFRGSIEEGYHSYVRKNHYPGLSERRLKFYIPKGTKYYYNYISGEYVSEKIYRKL